MKKKNPVVRAPAALLWAEIFVLGAAALVVEILGTRVLSPVFGSGIYSWAAMISVTLAALAAGYRAGGVWADRGRGTIFFQGAISAAGGLVLAVPVLKGAVLSFSSTLGLRAGCLAGAGLLFGPPLFVLGATGPMAIRLLTESLERVGRGVGNVYAVSTAGSVAGALLTGYVLVPHVGVRAILLGLGSGLAALGGAGLAVCRDGGAGVSFLLAAGGVLSPLVFPAPPASAGEVMRRASFYGEVRVLDMPGDLRMMLLDGVPQGAVTASSGEPAAEYLYGMELLPYLRPGRRRALVIGLGAGIVPTSYERHHGLVCDVVEVDAVVVRAARDHFGFSPSGRVAVEDGRTFVEKTDQAYDFVVLDAFASDRIPFHLFTREFFSRVRDRLAPGGALAVNTIGDPAGREWASVYKTLAAVFRHVRGHCTREGDNMIFLASDEDFPEALDLSSIRPAARPSLEDMLARRMPPPSPEALAEAVVFTDDFNPVDRLYEETLSRWRDRLLRSGGDFLTS